MNDVVKLCEKKYEGHCIRSCHVPLSVASPFLGKWQCSRAADTEEGHCLGDALHCCNYAIVGSPPISLLWKSSSVPVTAVSPGVAFP